jgi:hypothetical protein
MLTSHLALSSRREENIYENGGEPGKVGDDEKTY